MKELVKEYAYIEDLFFVSYQRECTYLLLFNFVMKKVFKYFIWYLCFICLLVFVDIPVEVNAFKKIQYFQLYFDINGFWWGGRECRLTLLENLKIKLRPYLAIYLHIFNGQYQFFRQKLISLFFHLFDSIDDCYLLYLLHDPFMSSWPIRIIFLYCYFYVHGIRLDFKIVQKVISLYRTQNIQNINNFDIGIL